MGSARNETVKKYRYYQVVDIDTGEILIRPNKKEYVTVNTDKIIRDEQFTERGYVKTRRHETTTRYVKHTGQHRIEI